MKLTQEEIELFIAHSMKTETKVFEMMSTLSDDIVLVFELFGKLEDQVGKLEIEPPPVGENSGTN
jgi:hypothetical protein